MPAELHRTARGLVAYGLDRIDPEKDIKITLIEAAPRILPALPERISRRRAEFLKDLKVDVRTGSRVTEVTSEGVKLADGSFIPSELVVWAAGVKGPDVLSHLDGLEVSRTDQLVVTETLQTTRDPDIFAIGDCAYLVPEGAEGADPAARAGGASGGSHLFTRAAAPVAGQAAAAVPLPRLRLAGLARRVLDRRQPDGLHRRPAACSSRACLRG